MSEEKLSISIEKASFFARHGVFDQEQVVGNEFCVSVVVTVPVDTLSINDNLSDTISYADIYSVIAEEMSKPAKLIETVGYKILNAIKNRWNYVERIVVTIEKLSPPIPCFDGKASISLEFQKK